MTDVTEIPEALPPKLAIGPDVASVETGYASVEVLNTISAEGCPQLLAKMLVIIRKKAKNALII